MTFKIHFGEIELKSCLCPFKKKFYFIYYLERGRRLKSSEDVDIALMYIVIRQLYHQNPQNGWGNHPGEHDISTADDIERIRYCRNRICHTDASGMETDLFNESVLELLGVICACFYICIFHEYVNQTI